MWLLKCPSALLFFTWQWTGKFFLNDSFLSKEYKHSATDLVLSCFNWEGTSIRSQLTQGFPVIDSSAELIQTCFLFYNHLISFSLCALWDASHNLWCPGCCFSSRLLGSQGCRDLPNSALQNCSDVSQRVRFISVAFLVYLGSSCDRLSKTSTWMPYFSLPHNHCFLQCSSFW